MPFIFKINVSLKKGDLKSTNISNIFNIFYIFYRNLFALGFLYMQFFIYAVFTKNVGNNFKKNIGSCLGSPTTKNHFCHIRRAVLGQTCAAQPARSRWSRMPGPFPGW